MAQKKGNMPPVQAYLAQLVQQNQLIIGFLETVCRIGLGQSEDDIKKAQGLTFPVGPSKEELIEAMEQELEKLRIEDEGAELAGQLAFIETDEKVAEEPSLD